MQTGRVFIELPSFTAFLKSERIDDALLRQLQIDIIRGGGERIVGAGGLKKIRWKAAHSGKSGSLRAVFADYEDRGVCVLVMAYRKNVRDDLSAAEVAEIRRLKEQLDRAVRRGGE